MLYVAGRTRFKNSMNTELLGYGMAVAWIALALYVVSMASRQRKLVRELENVRVMMDGEKRA